MKQNWEIYRDTCILGAAMAMKKKWMNTPRGKNRKSNSMSKR